MISAFVQWIITNWLFSDFSDIKAEYAGNEELNASEAPHLLRVIQSYKPNVFESNIYSQKFGKPSTTLSFNSRHPNDPILDYSFTHLACWHYHFAIPETLSVCLFLFIFFS